MKYPVKDIMNIKERFQRNITIKQYEVNLMIITGIFLTLFLFKAWPRFRSDAMSIEWYWYLSFMILFALPYSKKVLLKR